MANITLLGGSGVGKTCFIYAMSEIMARGVSGGEDMLFTMFSNTLQQQNTLSRGFMTLLQDKKWPQPTSETTTYEFRLRLQHKGRMLNVLPYITIYDFRGGMLQSDLDDDAYEYELLMRKFIDSVAIIYIIDGVSLRNALNAGRQNAGEAVYARQQIRIVENLLITFRQRLEERNNQRHEFKDPPPLLVAISKADVLTESELSCGKEFIMSSLPSVFSSGSETVAAITHFSLGDNIEGGLLNADLATGAETNIHIPILFGVYAELSAQYENASNDNVKIVLWEMMSSMRSMFRGRLDIYINGSRAIEL